MPKSQGLKLFFVIFVLFFSTTISYGQGGKSSEPKHELYFGIRGSEVFPWYSYTGEKFTFSARYNVDAEGTVGVCGGKKIGGDSFSIIPEACGYFGKESAVGPEVWILGKKGKFEGSGYLQGFKGIKGTGLSYAFSFFQSEYNFSKHFGLGVGGQVYKEIHPKTLKTEVDLGPSFKITFGRGRMYVRLMPLWRVTQGERGKFILSGGWGYNF